MTTDTIRPTAHVPLPASDQPGPDPARVKRKARVAGLLYLAIFVIAPFAFFYAPR